MDEKLERAHINTWGPNCGPLAPNTYDIDIHFQYLDGKNIRKPIISMRYDDRCDGHSYTDLILTVIVNKNPPMAWLEEANRQPPKGVLESLRHGQCIYAAQAIVGAGLASAFFLFSPDSSFAGEAGATQEEMAEGVARQDSGDDADQPETEAPPAGPDPPPTESTKADAEASRMSSLSALPTVSVIGSHQAAREMPGSAHYLDTEQIERQNYQNVDQVLRRIPGVYARQEDGLGLFPNISLRGVDSTRSAKVTLMEDGVLTAPAPYSAPAAYYSPTVGRMNALEILKGSSQVKYGPHTTGGVVNYVSTPIPGEQRAYIRTTFGTDNELIAHTYAGETLETELGSVGWLIEGYFRSNDGFKQIDETASFVDGDDTGFTRYEPMVKLAWEPNSRNYQRFEAKLGYTDMDANLTYLGLSEEDFKADPFRRYTSTRFDNIKITQLRSYLRHIIAVGDNVAVTTTGYYNSFQRNWFKLHDLKDAGGTRKSPSEAIAEGGSHLDVLRGEADGELRLRNNSRDYYLGGIESVLDWRIERKRITHDVTGGLRYHFDEIRRNQKDELFSVRAGGDIAQTDPGVQGNAGNRRQRTRAIAGFVQDAMSIGKWTVTPGIRYEFLDQDHKDFNKGSSGNSTMSLLSGGVGLTYQASDPVLIFGGVHRGVSPPGPRAADKGLSAETSIAVELGSRYSSPNEALGAEFVGFFTRFDDLIVIDNIGGAGTGDSENVGKVNSYGIELAADFDLGVQQRWSFSNPYWGAFTWTKAQCDGDAVSDDPESLFAGCKDGNDIPYVPQYQFAAGTGVHFHRAGLDIEFQFVDESFSTGSNTSEQIKILSDGSAQPDSRFGKTDSYLTADVSGYLQVREGVRLIGGIQNLFDEQYLVSRHPLGPRPGRGRYVYGGVAFDF